MYSIIIATSLVAAEIFSLIDTDFHAHGHSVEHRVVLTLIDIFAMTGAVAAILTESFVYKKEKMQLFNNFISIHGIFFNNRFMDSKPLKDASNFFTTCMLLLIILTAFTVYVWGPTFSVFVVIARSLVLTIMVMEISIEIYCCNYYISTLNESILLRFAEHSNASDEIDFKPTSLYSGAADIREVVGCLREKNNSGSVEYVKIYDLLLENLTNISQRFTFTFLSTVFASFLTFVTTAHNYVSNKQNTIHLISYTTWLLLYTWYLVSTSIAMELLKVQVEKIIQNVSKIAISQQKDIKLKHSLEKLMTLLLRRKPTLVIGGVMQVDFTFVYAVLAMTTSYMIIFIQMDHS